jgi:hypothetical protein
MSNTGRPTLYTEELGADICKRIMDGESLRQICDGNDMPNRSTVHDWLAKDESFADHYARAREVQADTYADDITAIADEAKDRDTAAAAKVRVDARKWVASKLRPKRYGDKLDLDANINGNITIQTVDYSSADINDTP